MSNNYWLLMKQEWKNMGKCPSCGDSLAISSEGKPLRLCQKHIDQQKQNKLNLRNRRAALCLCVKCGAKLTCATPFVRATCDGCKTKENLKKRNLNIL